MTPKKLQSSVWALAQEQHGVITRAQLLGLGYGPEAIRHRLVRRRVGIVVHRRSGLDGEDLASHRGIPVTSPVCTIVDLSSRLSPRQLKAVLNEADKLDLVNPEGLRQALDARAGRPGVAVLRDLLDRQTFSLTDSELERLFIPIARRGEASFAAYLPSPRTGRRVNGFEARPPSRHATGCATERTWRRVSSRCASPMRR